MDYRPFLAKDKNYLADVASKIQGKDPIEEIRFEYLTETLNELGFSGDPYKFASLENLLSERVHGIIEDTYKILGVAMGDDKKKALVLRLWDYLAESDRLEKADLIFTFGGQGEARVTEAIKLFKEGWGEKILFTGRRAAYMPEVEISEAEVYAKKAIGMGIKKEDLVLETEAKNTVENAVNSIKLLKERNWRPKKIILINHNFQMRRSYLTFKTNVDWEAKLMRYPVIGEKYSRDNFWQELAGWQFVTYEYFKLYGGRLMRHF